MYDVVEALRRIYCSTTGYDYAHVFVPEERRWLRNAAECGRFRAPADPIDPVALLDRLTQVEAFERFLHRSFPGKTRFSIEGVDMMVPILDEVIAESAEAGDQEHPDRHGASRPAERDGARAEQAVRADPRRVQGSGLVEELPGGHGLDRRRQVPRRRPSRHQGRRGAGSRRVDAAQSQPPRSGRPDRRGHGAGGGDDGGGAGGAEVRSRAQRADPDSRRRGLPRPGRRRRNAEPEPAARLQHRRDDPHHRQQPARVHDRVRGRLQHVVRERPGARLQDSDRPRQRRRSGGVRRGGAAGDRVSREVPA